jgi:hypothetical protein
MQCPNCHFENMPGNTACVRCGGSLQLATADVSVEPPRAPRWAKRVRPWLPWPSYRYQRGDVLRWWRSAVPTMLTKPATLGTDMGVWLRMLIPGWAQRHSGQPMRGAYYFFIWLAFAVLAVLAYGLWLGDVALLLMLCVHAVSILDILWPEESLDRFRLAAFAGATVILLFWIFARVPWIVGELRIGH